MIKINELVTNPAWAKRLHRVAKSLPPELIDYKGLTRYQPMLVDFLSKYDDGK